MCEAKPHTLEPRISAALKRLTLVGRLWIAKLLTLIRVFEKLLNVNR